MIEFDERSVGQEDSEGEETETNADELDLESDRSLSTVTKRAPASTKKKKNTKHRPWSEYEREAVKRNLHHILVLNQLPGKKAIEDCISKEPSLSTRSWRNVKDFCRNALKSMKF